ncbi:MAG: ABC transporter ATP-binding protein [Nannocystaceae bacterium]
MSYVADPESSILPLELRGIARAFGRRSILRGVDLRVGRGEIVGLMGANGAGKTTLFSIIAGLLCADGGTCRFADTDLEAGAVAIRARLAYVAHGPQLYPLLTARENLELAAQLRDAAGASSREAGGMLERLGLAAHADRRIEAFSRGMAQRASLARALAAAPELMLLDEPLTALDRDGQALVAEIMREERDRGAGIVLCSHDLETVLSVSDRVVLLEHGVISGEVRARECVDLHEYRRLVTNLGTVVSTRRVGAVRQMA